MIGLLKAYKLIKYYTRLGDMLAASANLSALTHDDAIRVMNYAACQWRCARRLKNKVRKYFGLKTIS